MDLHVGVQVHTLSPSPEPTRDPTMTIPNRTLLMPQHRGLKNLTNFEPVCIVSVRMRDVDVRYSKHHHQPSETAY